MLKRCPACKERKPAEVFYRSRTTGKLSSYCRPCRNARSAVWSRTHVAENRAKALRWFHKQKVSP